MSDEVKEYSLEEIKRHKSNESAWCVYNNGVYDVTKFLDDHPGGGEQLLDACGSDLTVAFEDIGHSAEARQILKMYKIGELRMEDRSSKEDSTSHKCCVIL